MSAYCACIIFLAILKDSVILLAMKTELIKTKSSGYLLSARGRMRLRQGDMAKLLGVRQVNLCKWERGYTMPPGDIILRAMELAKGRR